MAAVVGGDGEGFGAGEGRITMVAETEGGRKNPVEIRHRGSDLHRIGSVAGRLSREGHTGVRPRGEIGFHDSASKTAVFTLFAPISW